MLVFFIAVALCSLAPGNHNCPPFIIISSTFYLLSQYISMYTDILAHLCSYFYLVCRKWTWTLKIILCTTNWPSTRSLLQFQRPKCLKMKAFLCIIWAYLLTTPDLPLCCHHVKPLFPQNVNVHLTVEILMWLIIGSRLRSHWGCTNNILTLLKIGKTQFQNTCGLKNFWVREFLPVLMYIVSSVWIWKYFLNSKIYECVKVQEISGPVYLNI